MIALSLRVSLANHFFVNLKEPAIFDELSNIFLDDYFRLSYVIFIIILKHVNGLGSDRYLSIDNDLNEISISYLYTRFHSKHYHTYFMILSIY